MEAYYVPEKSKSKSGFKNFALVVLVILFMYGLSVLGFALQGSMPSYVYRESVIIGKNRDEIKEIYGEPDIRFVGNYGYKINCFITTNHFYWIDFDENGIAYETWTGCGEP